MKRVLIAFENNLIAAGVGVIVALASLSGFAYGSGGATALNIATAGLFAIFITRYHIELRSAVHGAMLLFFFCALFSVMPPENPIATRSAITSLADALLLAFMFGYVPVPLKRKIIAVGLMAGVWFSAISVLWSLQQSLLVGDTPFLRGYMVNPNAVAGYLLLCLPLSFMFWEGRERYGVAVSIVLFAGILASRSRAAIVIALVVLAVYMVRRKNIMRQKRLLAVALLAGVGSLVWLFAVKAVRMDSLLDRWAWYRAAAMMFTHNISSGIGWGNFGSLYPVYRVSQGLNTLYAHNIVLQLLAEVGICGFFSFALLLYAFARKARHSLHEGESLYLPIVLAVSGFMAFNMFDYSFYVPGIMSLSFICIGAVETRTPRPRVHRLLPGIIAIVLYAVSIYMLVLPFAAESHYFRGTTLMHEGAFDEAANEMKTALHLDPLNYQAHNALAGVYYARYAREKVPSDLVAAIDEQSKSLQQYPHDARSLSDLAWLYWTGGNREMAIATMGQAVCYDRFNPHYADNLARFKSEAAD